MAPCKRSAIPSLRRRRAFIACECNDATASRIERCALLLTKAFVCSNDHGYVWTMRVLIVGCGYVGREVGIQLVNQGHEVFGLRRSSSGVVDLKGVGIEPLVADV